MFVLIQNGVKRRNHCEDPVFNTQMPKLIHHQHTRQKQGRNRWGGTVTFFSCLNLPTPLPKMGQQTWSWWQHFVSTQKDIQLYNDKERQMQAALQAWTYNYINQTCNKIKERHMHKRKIFAGFGGGVLVFFFLSYQFDKSVPGIYNFLFLTNLNHNIKKKIN